MLGNGNLSSHPYRFQGSRTVKYTHLDSIGDILADKVIRFDCIEFFRCPVNGEGSAAAVTYSDAIGRSIKNRTQLPVTTLVEFQIMKNVFEFLHVQETGVKIVFTLQVFIHRIKTLSGMNRKTSHNSS